jgi:glucose/mannose transport system permease protein
MKKSRKLIGFLVVSPSIVAIAIFVYGFISSTVRMSFSNWNSYPKLVKGEFQFVGWKNYERLFKDVRFQTDLWNTLFFTLFFILGCIVIGLFIANLLDRKLKGGRFFQNIFLFPYALSLVVTGTIWSWFFAPGNYPLDPSGINLLLNNLGLGSLQWGWFTSTDRIWNFNVALIPVIIAATWQLSGYTMAMYLAGMRGIPTSLIEAARVDGATTWQVFWKVKLPLLKTITLSAMIILGHISLKIFDLVYAMTGSGPNNVTDMPAVYMYDLTFDRDRYALGSGVAVIMLVMVAIVIIPYLLSTLKKEDRA